MTKPLGSFTGADITAAAAQQYSAGEADMHVVPGRTALLIVDIGEIDHRRADGAERVRDLDDPWSRTAR